MLKTCRIWSTLHGSTVIREGVEVPAFIQEDLIEIIHTYTASNHIDMMQKYHAYMGFEAYRPMLDEDGQPYPEDSEEYV